MSTLRYENGIVRQFWDDTARTYTEWDSAGTQTLTRPYTPEENARADADAAAQAAQTNESTLRSRADAALAGNLAYINLSSRTTAQVAAQVLALTKQNNALIQLALRRFDSTDGTA